MVNGEGSVRYVEASFSSMEHSHEKSIATSSALSASIPAPSSTGMSCTSINTTSSAIDQVSVELPPPDCNWIKPSEPISQGEAQDSERDG
ncbi:hypothetical protein AAC387_Pa11g1745 [Persea americana]